MKLRRYEDNPILAPTENWWEEYLVFNPGATIFDNKIYLLYRAQGRDRISRFGIALSEDGRVFDRFSDPIDADANEPFERLGIEDPRITKIGDIYYITYTAASVYPIEEAKKVKFAPSLSSDVPWRVRACLMTTTDFKSFERKGVLLPDLDTKDLALFPEKIDGKFILIHRVYPHMYVAESENLNHWQDKGVLVETRPGFWDSERVGTGAPPIKTEKGWLVIYHGVDDRHVYRLGLLLLDLNDPRRVIYRSKEPIFEPEESYEKEGYVSNVVFTCGAVEKRGQYFVYYGAADKVVGVATIEKEELLSHLP